MNPIALCFALCCAFLSTLSAAQPETLDIRVSNEPLLVALRQVASQCDLGLIVEHGHEEALQKPVTLTVKKTPWLNVDQFLGEFGLTMKIQGNHLLVTDRDSDFRARLELRFYDVHSLLHGTMNHPGWALSIPDPGGMGICLLPPVPGSRPPTQDALAELLKATVAPDSWKRTGVSIGFMGATLAVVTLPEIHAQIQSQLDTFERVAARQLVMRIHRLDPAAPTIPVIDAATWQPMAVNAGTPIGSLILSNGQQNHHYSGNVRAANLGIYVTQGQHQPIITTVADGLVVDAEPQITIGGVLVTFRFSAVGGQHFESHPITDLANKPVSTIEQVSQNQAEYRDTRLIPFGGAALFHSGQDAYAVTFEIVNGAAPTQVEAPPKP